MSFKATLDDAGVSTWQCGCKTWKFDGKLHLRPCDDKDCVFRWALIDEARAQKKIIRSVVPS